MKTPSRILWFVRHGERVDNVDKTWKKTAERWDDPPLSARGHQQAREVGVALMEEPIDHVICSPFTRCVETATEILSLRKDPPLLYIEPGMGESLNACMSPPGRPTMEQIKKINPKVNDTYEPVYTTLPPEHGGDEGCIPRVAVTLRNILAKYPTGNILFISHGSPIAACHVALCGSWNYVGQCTIGKIVSAAGNFQCEYFGDKRHLTDKTNLREHESKKGNAGEQRLEISLMNK
ncbi:hypothetical protein V3C99_012564 [Haemonchus contortus]